MTITTPREPGGFYERMAAGYVLLGIDYPGGRRELCITYDVRKYGTADALCVDALMDPGWRTRWSVVAVEDVSLPVRHLHLRSIPTKETHAHLFRSPLRRPHL